MAAASSVEEVHEEVAMNVVWDEGESNEEEEAEQQAEALLPAHCWCPTLRARSDE